MPVYRVTLASRRTIKELGVAEIEADSKLDARDEALRLGVVRPDLFYWEEDEGGGDEEPLVVEGIELLPDTE